MRPSYLLAIGTASLASAQSNVVTIVGTGISTCTETTSTNVLSTSTFTWTSLSTLPTPSSYNSTSMSTATWTETITTIVPTPIVTSYTTSSPTNASATSPVTVTNGNAAPHVDGLAGDRSVLGLVVFFALSLCLL